MKLAGVGTVAVRPPDIGDVLIVRLPAHVPPGREQEGLRPVVVVGLPERLGTPRYPMLVAAPLTSQLGDWVKRAPGLYPVLKKGTANLLSDSAVMLEHLRGIDATRVVRRLGVLTARQYKPIKDGLERMMGFS
jgi:mRNA interferase MazF